ncbi:hypothetical protein [Streptomyces sp. NPDC005209]|uniref:hypothetical protein n=1 Tax=Streptomyces sp. NPDC005209 TaxID=3156715 RepID=UPI0033A9B07E
MDSEEHVCPVCGQPVHSAVRRHKTLGIWVPEWVPGPCHNPDCAAYEGPGPTVEQRHPDPESAPDPDPSDPAAEGAER